MESSNNHSSDNDSENENSKVSKQDKLYAIDLVDKNIIDNWRNEQIELKKQLKLYDTEPWQVNRKLFNKDAEKVNSKSDNNNEYLRYVAGLDISFIKDTNKACSGLFVFDLSDNMKLVYQEIDKEPIEMDQPYVPGFLAYRESPFLLEKLKNLKKNYPLLYPQCLFIDGNGLLHVDKFGMACHIGVMSDTPTIGVSKKLYQVFGLENGDEHKNKVKTQLKNQGDYFELMSNEETPSILGLCYKSHSNTTNPIYISIGNKISWNTCVWLVGLVTKKYRIPEPIRQADLMTREYLRKLTL